MPLKSLFLRNEVKVNANITETYNIFADENNFMRRLWKKDFTYNRGGMLRYTNVTFKCKKFCTNHITYLILVYRVEMGPG